MLLCLQMVLLNLSYLHQSSILSKQVTVAVLAFNILAQDYSFEEQILLSFCSQKECINIREKK